MKIKQKIKTNTFPGHVKIQVSRTNLFDDSFNQVYFYLVFLILKKSYLVSFISR